jgi:hypothetical protein
MVVGRLWIASEVAVMEAMMIDLNEAAAYILDTYQKRTVTIGVCGRSTYTWRGHVSQKDKGGIRA